VKVVPGDFGDDLEPRDAARDLNLSVMNQLIANVSSVPIVRQLMALRTDLVWVSAPRNKITRRASLPARLLNDLRTYHAGALRLVPVSQIRRWTVDVITCTLHKKFEKLVELTD
jgi:hypothetical protein